MKTITLVKTHGREVSGFQHAGYIFAEQSVRYFLRQQQLDTNQVITAELCDMFLEEKKYGPLCTSVCSVETTSEETTMDTSMKKLHVTKAIGDFVVVRTHEMRKKHERFVVLSKKEIKENGLYEAMAMELARDVALWDEGEWMHEKMVAKRDYFYE